MNNIAQNFKESLLANDCKLVYPNHQKMNVRVFAKRIEVRIFAKKFFSLMKKAQDIEQLTPIQKLLHRGQLFLNEEITNKNIMEPKFGGIWVDNKFIENKEYKYFITEFAALVDSL